jgi:hypothetical protein
METFSDKPATLVMVQPRFDIKVSLVQIESILDHTRKYIIIAWNIIMNIPLSVELTEFITNCYF